MRLLSKQGSRRYWFIVAAAVWCVVVSAGFGVLWNYGTTPGIAGEPPLQWPRGSAIERNPRKLILLMFAHPQCPCTHASIDELARILAQCPDRLDAHVLFPCNPESSAEWLKDRN